MTDESVVSRAKVHMRYFCKIVITYWIYSVISPHFSGLCMLEMSSDSFIGVRDHPSLAI